ncbi:MAG: hypothetical protein GMKNLPBB_02737 [Myxococcota bacterium]|nr:hypothetical protein [Myxococcota bacterium]
MTKEDAVKSCKLFQGFSESGIRFFAAAFQETAYRTGEAIIRETETGNSLYIVSSGRMSVETLDNNGMPCLLTNLGPCDYFGEIALLKGGAHLVTITAIEECRVLELSQKQFLELQKQKPQTCLKLVVSIMQHFSGKLRETQGALKKSVTQ